jgi:transcription antitermination factor NusG
MSLAVDDRRWFVLRLKPSYNLALQAGSTDLAFAALKELGYDVYLPRRRYDRHNRRLRVMAEWSEPLMPGYLFIAHPRPGRPIDDWAEIFAVNEVVGPLHGDRGPLPIPAAVIESLMTAEFESAYDETKAAKRYRGETGHAALKKRFPRGKSVRIKGGPFASFIAKVDRLTHQERVKALIDILGRMVAVELEPDNLEESAQTPDRAA